MLGWFFFKIVPKQWHNTKYTTSNNVVLAAITVAILVDSIWMNSNPEASVWSSLAG